METVKPCAGGLLQAIERLDELADVILAMSIDKTGRLVAVDLFVEDAIEEGILHVQLVHNQLREDAKVSTVRIVAGLTTGEKVSPKSMPGR